MARVTRYTDVRLTDARLRRTKEGREMMKQIGLCIAQGGHVEFTSYQDAEDGHERADAVLYWREHPHKVLKHGRQ